MIDRKQIQEIASSYEPAEIKVGVLASHSALDVADGAVDEGFRTVLYCQRGRDRTYTHFFRSRRDRGSLVRGCVDEFKVYGKFAEMMSAAEQEAMRADNIVFVPNRSFSSYVSVSEIEDNFEVPLLGSRNMLRTEERSEKQNYYWLLEKTGLPYPEKIDNPKDISELSIIKLHHAQKKLERGFFSAASYKEYQEKSGELIKQGVITEEDLADARIEQYVIGPVFNLDFFYNPLEKELPKIELIGVDWRFESSLDGHVRLPAPQQMSLVGTPQELPEYTVCGHNSATIRESLLEKAFELAEKWVAAAKKHYKPGIIGAFCLQTCIDKDMNYHIYDVAPRIGGGTNVHMNVGHAYGNSLWHTNMSTGRRTARLLRDAIEQDRLKEVVT